MDTEVSNPDPLPCLDQPWVLLGLIPTSIPPHNTWWSKKSLLPLSFHHIDKCPEESAWAVKDLGFHSCFVKKKSVNLWLSMNLPARCVLLGESLIGPSIPLSLSWIRTEGNRKMGGMENTRTGTTLFSTGNGTCWEVEKPRGYSLPQEMLITVWLQTDTRV